MEPEIIQLLSRLKGRLEEINVNMRPGSLGKAKNDDLISEIEAVLPKSELPPPNAYDPDLVYPKK